MFVRLFLSVPVRSMYLCCLSVLLVVCTVYVGRVVCLFVCFDVCFNDPVLLCCLPGAPNAFCCMVRVLCVF